MFVWMAVALASEDPRITASEIEAHVAVLASDRFEGRMPGTEGGALAETYVADAFAAAGVSPGFDGYRQPVSLVLARARSATLTLRGEAGPVRLSLGDFAVSGGATDRVSGPVVFAGHGVVTEERDDYGDLDVGGKVVLLLPGAPGLAGGPVPARQGTHSWKKDEALRRGAAAVLWIHHDSMGFPWGAVQGQVASDKAHLADDPGIVSMMVPGVVGEEAVGATWEALSAEAAAPDFAARSLPVRVDLKRAVERRPVDSHNVVGVIRGTELPDQVVLYTAHWDHVGIGEPVDGDPIYNGAVDNATGTAALIEIAEAFAAEPPRRTVVLVATTAEEQGLLGAEHYASHPLFPLEDTVAVLNLDALFPFGETESVTVTAPGSTDLERWFGPAARAQGRALLPDPMPEAQAWFRSDHYPLAARGVPAMFAVGGPGAEPSAGILERYADYLNRRYHKPADELDDSWDFAGIVQDARLYHAAGRAIADDRERPRWADPPS